MGNAKHIGRVGALAVALGIGTAMAGTPWVAAADPSVDSPSAADSASSDASESAAGNRPAAGSPSASATAGESKPETSIGISRVDRALTARDSTKGTPRSGLLRRSGGVRTSTWSLGRTSDADDAPVEIPNAKPRDEQVVTATPAGIPGTVAEEAVEELELPAVSQPGPEPGEADQAPAAEPDIGDQRSDHAEPDPVRPLDIDRPSATRVTPSRAPMISRRVDARMHAAAVTVADDVVPASGDAEPQAPIETGIVAAQHVQPVKPVPPPVPGARLASNLLSWVGLNPAPLDGPTLPSQSPAMWAVLAWARRPQTASTGVTSLKQGELTSMAAPGQSASIFESGCACANGQVLVQWGSASCQAEGDGSFAMALGNNSSAVATGGDNNVALVLGHDSTATAAGGDGNLARATGDGSHAFAGSNGTGNDGNTATAVDGGFAAAGTDGADNDGNTASATGAQAYARAGVAGDDNDNNSAIANGVDAHATAAELGVDKDDNRAVVLGSGAAFAALGGDDSDGNTATVIHSGLASAGGAGDSNSGNTATAAFGGRADAGNFGNDNDDNVAHATGPDAIAVAGPASFLGILGDNNDENLAIAGFGGFAHAGGNGDDNTANTAIAGGVGSQALAGTDGDDQDGFTAVAMGGDVVAVP
ncbi:hypothetical protein [Mycolicibacterium sp. HK-90]|uniref:hypothetical protein n=1 Tax=Mycolicibacterium sp. HK-90 TaxID=3056937 RepID=UPI00265A23AC|nr:hypothetical protein [Mycolicibacterium sp. HK-90]WKG02625.1 hypothetical protein QU592_26010 [Mycolicibacterium sp. HK-90]